MSFLLNRSLRLMRCVPIILFTLLFSLETKAQFRITPSGVVCTDSLGYYVVPVPELTAKQLYQSVTGYLLANYPTDNVSTAGLPDETLIANIRVPHAFACYKFLWQTTYADVELNITFRFKDGKMRIDAPIVTDMSYLMSNSDHPEHPNRQPIFITAPDFSTQVSEACLFDRKGEVALQRAVTNFDAWLNTLVHSIAEHVQREQTWADDW